VDYKVRKIYVYMLARERNNHWKSDADEALKALIDFKRRYPTQKCLYWVAK